MSVISVGYITQLDQDNYPISRLIKLEIEDNDGHIVEKYALISDMANRNLTLLDEPVAFLKGADVEWSRSPDEKSCHYQLGGTDVLESIAIRIDEEELEVRLDGTSAASASGVSFAYNSETGALEAKTESEDIPGFELILNGDTSYSISENGVFAQSVNGREITAEVDGNAIDRMPELAMPETWDKTIIGQFGEEIMEGEADGDETVTAYGRIGVEIPDWETAQSFTLTAYERLPNGEKICANPAVIELTGNGEIEIQHEGNVGRMPVTATMETDGMFTLEIGETSIDWLPIMPKDFNYRLDINYSDGTMHSFEFYQNEDGEVFGRPINPNLQGFFGTDNVEAAALSDDSPVDADNGPSFLDLFNEQQAMLDEMDKSEPEEKTEQDERQTSTLTLADLLTEEADYEEIVLPGSEFKPQAGTGQTGNAATTFDAAPVQTGDDLAMLAAQHEIENV